MGMRLHRERQHADSLTHHAVFHLENRLRGGEIVAWRSKGGGMSCLAYIIVLGHL